jgi:hypothetical protein
MAFVPRPVESSSEEKGGESSPNTAPGKGNEERPLTFHSIDSRTGLVAYENHGGIAQDWNPPDHVKGPANGIHQVTFSTESSPFRDPTTPPGRIYSRDSTIITGTAMGNPAFGQNMPKQWPVSSEMMHGVPLSFTPTPYVPPAPGAVRLVNSGTTPGPQGPSSAYKASSTTWESDVTLKRSVTVTEPSRTVQPHRVVSGPPYIPPAVQNFWKQSAGDGPVLGQPQWQRLVLTAAAKS